MDSSLGFTTANSFSYIVDIKATKFESITNFTKYITEAKLPL